MEKKSLEDNFSKLEEIIRDMEKKELTLEEMFHYYKSGIELVKESSAMIDTIEKEIKVINDAGETNEVLDPR